MNPIKKLHKASRSDDIEQAFVALFILLIFYVFAIVFISIICLNIHPYLLLITLIILGIFSFYKAYKYATEYVD